jgi:hypothetical protein
MELTGDNKADIYYDYSVKEWNGYRFKYKDDWSVRKEYDGESLKKIVIGNGDKEITIGEKEGCNDINVSRCVIGGYGSIMETIITRNNDEWVMSAFEVMVNSIIGYQGTISYDSKRLREVIDSFIKGRIDDDINKVDSLVTLSMSEDNVFDYIRSGECRWARYEYLGKVRFIDKSRYEIKAKVYEYYSSKDKETGSREVTFVVINDNGNYLIDGIRIGSLD